MDGPQLKLTLKKSSNEDSLDSNFPTQIKTNDAGEPDDSDSKLFTYKVG